MKRILAAVFALFLATPAGAQNGGTTTNHAFALGKGAGVAGFTSLLCGSAQLAVGQAAADPTCRTLSGDATLSAAGALTLATVNANVGTFGSATQCVTVTNNAKGLTTAVSAATCTPAIGSITGLGTGIIAALGANVGTAGAPVLFNGAGGTPSSLTLTNGTGLPIATGVSGLGTGVATAAAVAVGSAGSFVTNGGALGTPSSGVGTNLTALNASNISTGTLANARGGIGKVTLTQPATGSTVTVADGKTATVNNTLTFQGPDGATLDWSAWTSATPAVTSSGGAGLAATSIVHYKILGKVVHVIGAITVTAVGTASGDMRIAALPFTASTSAGFCSINAYNAADGTTASGIINGALLTIRKYDASFPTGAVTYGVNFGGTCELP